jgi:hypothetical protein
VDNDNIDILDVAKTSANVPSLLLSYATEDDLRRAMQIVRGRVSKLTSSGPARERKNFSKEVGRRIRRKHKRLTDNRFAKPSIDFQPAPTPNLIADTLVPNRAKRWRVRNRKQTRIDVSSFSFIDDPASTFDKLRDIALAECQNVNSELNFRMPFCIDIAPLLVLGLMRRNMVEVFRGGKVTIPVDKVMRAVQLVDFLGMGLNDNNDNKGVWAFPLREAAARLADDEPSAGNNTRDKVAEDLVSKMDEWLEVATKRDGKYLSFSSDARQNLATMVCEILENCERHGPSSDVVVGEWACAGFLARRQSSHEGRNADYVCHLAFVNTGQTIAQGIAKSSHAQTAMAEQAYVATNRGGLSRLQSDDVLRTVLALQPGITRQQVEDTNSGGVGFRRILDAVFLLNEKATDASPKTVIISGDCCVRVADLYPRLSRNSQGVQGLYFNPENSMAQPPDPRYAFKIPYSFPGTIIATRFLIDPVIP